MKKEKHIKRHKELHKMLDELFADFLTHTGKGLDATVLELIEWSHKQTKNPNKDDLGI